MASALAHRYASALAEVTDKSGAETSAEAALAQLRSFSELMTESAELRNVLAAPSVTNQDKQDLLVSLGGRIGLSRPIRNLLFVMVDNRRLGIIDDLIEAFAELDDQRRGVERLRVVSAAPLDAAQRAAFLERFRQIAGRQVEAEFASDQSLLGGVVVRRGGQVIDGSLAAKLRSLSEIMAG